MANHMIVGPVLAFRGLRSGYWRTSALVVLKDDAEIPQLYYTVSGEPPQAAPAILLTSYKNYRVWRLEWAVPQTSAEQWVTYAVNAGEPFCYVVPARDASLRIGYGSCFGFSSRKDMTKVRDKNGMWKRLRRQHALQPYHLLIMGGDQVYADWVWEAVAPLRDWLNKPLRKRVEDPFTTAMQQQVAAFYFELYCRKWRQRVPAGMMRQIPTLMMWDDHDIFDGWGSFPPEQQACAVFQGIYEQARAHFRLFQLQARDEADLPPATLPGGTGYSYAHRIGNIALVALDLRSERTQDQVISSAGWRALWAWLENELTQKTRPGETPPTVVKHLLVLSSIPVVNVSLNILEAPFGFRPGQRDLQDDLQDQWLSRAHRAERWQLIQRLVHVARTAPCRVTIVSGDAHVASLGYIQAAADDPAAPETTIIHQLTSSAMVNVPPPGLVVYLMEKMLSAKIEEIKPGVTARLLPFPGTAQRLLAARNWLSLTLDAPSGIRAEWYVEGQRQPYVQFIPPPAIPPA